MKKTIKLKRILGRPASDVLGHIPSNTYSKNKVTIVAIALTAAMAMLLPALVFPHKILAGNDETRTFTVDVALGTPYAQNNVNPAADPSAFFPGDTFIQDGSIYPAHTIPGGKTTFNAKRPGAIGKYRARGTFTTDLPNFLRAVNHLTPADPELAFATEMFTFRPVLSGVSERSILMTDGTWPNAHFSANRVVLGGTGSFRNVVGEVHVENIGENIETLFCNFRLTFKLRQAAEGQWR